MTSRRAAKILAAATGAALVADLVLTSWAAQLVCGVALSVALCCIPDRTDSE